VRLGAIGQSVADLIARRADIGSIFEFPQHRLQAFRHVLGDAIEQEGRGPSAHRARPPGAQQSAVEKDRSGSWVRSNEGLVRRSAGLWQSGHIVSGASASAGERMMRSHAINVGY
jgi:hypothetical protein